MPMKRIVLSSASGLILLMSGAAIAAPAQKVETHGDWNVRCIERENVPPCDMVQAASQKESGEQVMQFSIAHAGKEDLYGVQIRVPLGVNLTGDAAIRIDEDADFVSLKYTRCDMNGCYLEKLMTPQDLEPFEQANEGMLIVLGLNGEPLSIPLSFDGFDDALKLMSENNRAWAERALN